ncbi:hypothetical protein O0L34_g19401 [Tuta absoluta]|nr:hypothetical protein O0L34_g19401 [Tuta absoluta]
MECGACNNSLSGANEEIVGCATCTLKFHLSCLGLPREEAKKIRTSSEAFTCPDCKAFKRKQRNSEGHSLGTPSVIPPGKESPNLASFNKTLGQMQESFNTMRKEMQAFTNTLNSTSQDIAQFRQDINNMKKQIKELDHFKTEVTSLRAKVNELRLELASRQQREFLRDIEITGITEQRSENITQIVQNVSTSLGIQLDPRDVDDVRRVGIV